MAIEVLIQDSQLRRAGPSEQRAAGCTVLEHPAMAVRMSAPGNAFGLLSDTAHRC